MMGQVKEASIQQLLAGETVLSGSNDFSCEDKMFSGIRNLLHSSHAHLLEGQILISLALVKYSWAITLAWFLTFINSFFE